MQQSSPLGPKPEVLMSRRLLPLVALTLLPACGSSPSASHIASEDGGTFKVLVIPPSAGLDWSTPNALVRTSAASKAKGELDRVLGRVKRPHPIGHMMVQLDCGDDSIALTGQTGGGSEFLSAFDGLGANFRTFPGFLDDEATVRPDIDLRRKNGRIAEMSFKVTGDMCRHLKGFLTEYKAHGAEKNYGGQFRPRRFEGAGCSAFTLAFVEVGGILKRSQYTTLFARDMQVGIGRIADYKGDGEYAYGSNLIGHDASGNLTSWPAGHPLKVQTAAVSPQSGWLTAWSDARDAGTNVAPDEQPSTVPWTIYDPALVFDFIQQTAANGGGDALGRHWTATKDLGATVIEADATDAVAQPYLDAQDDLRLD
jgi:hypothetical protein